MGSRPLMPPEVHVFEISLHSRLGHKRAQHNARGCRGPLRSKSAGPRPQAPHPGHRFPLSSTRLALSVWGRGSRAVPLYTSVVLMSRVGDKSVVHRNVNTAHSEPGVL